MKNESPDGSSSRDGNALSSLWRSPWTGWVGFRYLKSKKNSKFLSFITFISVFGVALGVTAMIVVLSVMDGFEAELRKRLMSSDLHILISPTQEVVGFSQGFVPKTSLDQSQVVQSLQKDPRVESVWPIVSTEAIFRTGRKVTGVVVKGISPERMARLKPQITESAEPQMLVERQGAEVIKLPGVMVGQELAYEMGVIPGDHISLISPTETDGPLSQVPRMKRFAVEGIYHSGLPEQELHTVFAQEGSVRSFLRRADVLSQWEITVKDFEQAPSIAEEIRPKLTGFRVQDWIQLNSHLFFSLKLERVAMFVILAFIIVVASFNIITTLTLMVLEKKREISIMKAMGARNNQVAAIFLAEGIFIGVLGVSGGVALGWIICSILRRYQFIKLPDIYYDQTLPVTFDPLYYVLVVVSALLIVFAACLYPSRRAAKINPLEGIRFG